MEKSTRFSKAHDAVLVLLIKEFVLLDNGLREVPPLEELDNRANVFYAHLF